MSDPAMLWLALLPYWTGEAAEVAGFPVPGSPATPFGERLSTFIADAEQQRRAQRSGALRPERMAMVEFWSPPDRQADELRAAVAELGGPAVVAQARLIADRLAEAVLDLPFAPVMEYWVEIARADREHRPDLAFLGMVRSLCRTDQRTAAADLITAAETAEPIAAVPLRDAIDAAHRLLHLANRRSDDAKALRDFQPRPEWAAALRDLLRRDDGTAWAMHLVGPGGTGKTSFIRYVTAGGFTRENGLTRIAAARVDFDHVSPAYPAGSPAQLLVELADELAAEADDAAGEQALMDCYAAARSANASGGPVDEAVRCFAALLTALGRPVLLMLDTCEELSRLDPADAPDAAVDMMFDLLGRVHAAVPGVRVLLSGRRRLHPRQPEWHGMTILPARGFRQAEALTFLTRPDGSDRMTPDLVELVLELSPERGEPDPRERRFSPYDLALYRQWWVAEKSITADALRDSGRLAYVEARIVKRLSPELLACLPAVALLGRFDEFMLAPALPAGTDAAAVLAELARQDWTDTDTDPASGSLILDVDEELRRALLDWCRSHEETRLWRARETLVVELAEQIRTRELGEISTAQLLCTLRLARPAGAVVLWEQVEGRTTEPADWRWIERVCPRLLGVIAEPPGVPEGDDGLAGNVLLGAAVRATALAAAARTGRELDRAGEWRAIRASLSGRAGDVADRLDIRAGLGEIAAGELPERLGDVTVLLRRAARFPGKLDGGVAAAIEAVADGNPAEAGRSELVASVREWQTITADPVVDATLRVCLARLDGDRCPLRTTDERAVRRTATHRSRWADWLAPPSGLLRLYLFQARQAHENGGPLLALPLPAWEAEAQAHRGWVDADRLLSQCLALRLGHGTVPAEHLERMLSYATARLRDPARLRLHTSIRPLFVTVSHGLFMLGAPHRARLLLEQRLAAIRQARAAGWRIEAGAARAALIDLARRMRDRAVMYAVADEDRAGRAWIAAALIDGDPPPRDTPEDGASPWRWHRRWQATSVNPGSGLALVPEPPDLTAAGDDPLLAGLLSGDAAEVAAVGGGPGTARLTAWSLTHERGLPQPSGDDVLTTVRPLLAAARPEELGRLGKALLDRVPPLCVALIALELGEQRALRDPRGAYALLELAAACAEARNPVLALQAVTLRALALVHTGEPPARAAAKAAVLSLNTAYERMREHLPAPEELPEWASLVEADTSPPAWAGWLARIRVAVAGLARARGLPGPVAPARADGSVELYPAAFGVHAPRELTETAATELTPVPRVGWRVQLAWVRKAVRAAVNPRITFRITPRSRQLTISVDGVPADWLATGGGTGDGSLRRRILTPRASGTVELGPGDEVPDLPPSMREAFRAPGKSRLVTRLLVNPSDQVRFWEAEIMDRLGVAPRETAAGWYRPWNRTGEPPHRPGPQRVVRLVGEPVRTRAVFQTGPPEVTRRTPEEIAALGADLIVLQVAVTAESAGGAPVRDVDALRFAVRCMDAGTRNVLLATESTATVQQWIAERSAALDARGTAPTPLELVDLARDLRCELAGDSAQHAVLFLTEGEDA
ncbi:AAA family ATPase [Actinoplanes cyaneus]|uniref:AAA family ATPase n=1 Tax=Actinoplanes cyaneus TaxID=52696 RepID=UPI001942CB1D|nr:AAA family ATPase [Actinoplanes cyaneus]